MMFESNGRKYPERTVCSFLFDVSRHEVCKCLSWCCGEVLRRPLSTLFIFTYKEVGEAITVLDWTCLCSPLSTPFIHTCI